jgi:hypothetical protein
MSEHLKWTDMLLLNLEQWRVRLADERSLEPVSDRVERGIGLTHIGVEISLN